MNLPSILRGAPLRSVEAYDSARLLVFDVRAPGADVGAGACTRVLALHKYKSPDELIQAHGRAARMPENWAWQPTPAAWRPVLKNGSGSVWSGCEAPDPYCDRRHAAPWRGN